MKNLRRDHSIEVYNWIYLLISMVIAVICTALVVYFQYSFVGFGNIQNRIVLIAVAALVTAIILSINGVGYSLPLLLSSIFVLAAIYADPIFNAVEYVFQQSKQYIGKVSLYATCIIAALLFVYILLRYSDGIYKFFAKGCKKIINVFVSVKKARYILLITISVLIPIILHNTIHLWDGWHYAATVIIAGVIGILVSVIINEDLSNTRNHPYTMAAVGVIIIAVACVYYNYTADKAFSILSVSISIFATVFVILLTEIICKTNTIAQVTGILLSVILLGVALGIILYNKNEDWLQLILLTEIIAVPTISIISVIVLLCAQHKWDSLFGKTIKENQKLPILISLGAVILWGIVFAALCIVRWKSLNLRTFLPTLAEGGVYIAIALMIVSVILGIVFIIYYTALKIRDKNEKVAKQLLRAGIFLASLFSLLMLCYAVKIGHNTEIIWNSIENMHSDWQLCVKAIIYIYGMLIIAFIFMMLISGSAPTNLYEKCGYYLRHEYIANSLHKYVNAEHREKYYRCINVLDMEKKKQGIPASYTYDAAILEELKMLCEAASSQYPLPRSMSDILGLDIAVIIMRIRDFCTDSISSLVAELKSDKLIIGFIKDLIDIFIH